MVVLSSVISGVGLGTTFPLFTIAVQNAVPQNMLGVATSTTTFFRSIGGSIGLAILGSALNNRFSSELYSTLPDSIKSALGTEILTSLTDNPQALVSAEAQVRLQESLTQVGLQGTGLLDQLLSGLRQALASSIARVFLISMVVVILAFIASFFMKELPIRRFNPERNKGTEKLQ